MKLANCLITIPILFYVSLSLAEPLACEQLINFLLKEQNLGSSEKNLNPGITKKNYSVSGLLQGQKIARSSLANATQNIVVAKSVQEKFKSMMDELKVQDQKVKKIIAQDEALFSFSEDFRILGLVASRKKVLPELEKLDNFIIQENTKRERKILDLEEYLNSKNIEPYISDSKPSKTFSMKIYACIESTQTCLLRGPALNETQEVFDSSDENHTAHRINDDIEKSVIKFTPNNGMEVTVYSANAKRSDLSKKMEALNPIISSDHAPEAALSTLQTLLANKAAASYIDYPEAQDQLAELTKAINEKAKSATDTKLYNQYLSEFDKLSTDSLRIYYNSNHEIEHIATGSGEKSKNFSCHAGKVVEFNPATKSKPWSDYRWENTIGTARRLLGLKGSGATGRTSAPAK